MKAVDLLVVDATVAGSTATAIGITGGTISHVGDGAVDAHEIVGAEGRLVTPGLIDCHTHLVFGGRRVDDFRRRVAGASYEEIATGGGGILSTVEATRASSEAELSSSARARLQWLVRSGVTTVEVKSGYGLDLDTEARMLAVARRLGAETGVTVHTTLLAAHVVPPEFRHDPDAYVGMVCDEIIPVVAASGLADSVDVFCDRIAFSPAQSDRVLSAATAAGLAVRVHADQLSDQGGAALAASHGALSADHLDHASTEGLAAMAQVGTVAVLVPGASVFLDEVTRPPVGEMRRLGVRMAVATDLNPGTSPLASLPLAMALACTRFGLDTDEAVAGATASAARALGLGDRGRLEPGMRGDLVVWHATDVADLAYWMGAPLAAMTVAGGTVLWDDGTIGREPA